MTPIGHAGAVFRSLDRKAVRIPLIIAGAVVLLVAAILLLLSREDWNFARGPIARFASARLGRAVRLDGDLRAHLLSLTPEVDVGGLKIGNPAWAGPGDTADVDLARLQARLMPLLALRLDMPLVELRAMRLDLRRDKTGRENWALNPQSTGQPLKLPPINRFLIRDGRLHLVDETRNLSFTGQVEASETPVSQAHLSQGGRGFRLEGGGKLNQEAFRMLASGGPLIGVRRDHPYPFRMDVQAGPSHIVADGQIARPFDLGALSGTIRLDGPDLARLYDLTGVTLPSTPPYRLSAHFERQATRYSFTGLGGTVGSTDLEGQLMVDRVRGRRTLTADLVSDHLYFPDLLAMMGGPPTRAAPAPAPATPAQITLPVGPAKPAAAKPNRRLLPDAPLYVERLRVMDADVRYRARSIRSGLFSVRRGAVSLTLKNGVLSLDPVGLDFDQGRLFGHIRIDAQGSPVKTDLDMRASNFGLEQLLTQKGPQPALEGVLEARAHLSGAGGSVHAAAAATNGEVVVAIPHGQMRQAFAELMGINVGRGLFLLLPKSPKQTDMRCAVAQFEVRDGMMNVQQMVIDTGVVTATGSGSINLGAESLNLKLKGHTKHPELLRIWTPINVGGSFAKPALGLDAAQVAAQGGAAAAIGALLGPLTVVLPFISPGLAKDQDCVALVTEAKQAGAPVKLSQTAPNKPGSRPPSTAPQHH